MERKELEKTGLIVALSLLVHFFTPTSPIGTLALVPAIAVVVTVLIMAVVYVAIFVWEVMGNVVDWIHACLAWMRRMCAALTVSYWGQAAVAESRIEFGHVEGEHAVPQQHEVETCKTPEEIEAETERLVDEMRTRRTGTAQATPLSAVVFIGTKGVAKRMGQDDQPRLVWHPVRHPEAVGGVAFGTESPGCDHYLVRIYVCQPDGSIVCTEMPEWRGLHTLTDEQLAHVEAVSAYAQEMMRGESPEAPLHMWGGGSDLSAQGCCP